MKTRDLIKLLSEQCSKEEIIRILKSQYRPNWDEPTKNSTQVKGKKHIDKKNA